MKILKTQDNSPERLKFKIKNKKWIFLIIHYYITFKKQPYKN